MRKGRPSTSNWSTASRQSRGYGAEWDRLRVVVLKRDCGICMCARCKADGVVRVAHEVDHVIPKSKGGTDDLANLQAINRDCHQRKTIVDEGGVPRVRVGLDGFPIVD